jgi:hypothetical protein
LALNGYKPQIYNILALSSSLYKYETWAIREWDKTRIMLVDMKFIGRMGSLQNQ